MKHLKVTEGFKMLNLLSTLTAPEIAELKICVPKLAETIQHEANQQIRWNEKLQAEEFARVVRDPRSRADPELGFKPNALFFRLFYISWSAPDLERRVNKRE